MLINVLKRITEEFHQCYSSFDIMYANAIWFLNLRMNFYIRHLVLIYHSPLHKSKFDQEVISFDKLDYFTH